MSSFSMNPPPANACQSSSMACSSIENKHNHLEILNFGKMVASAVFVATVAVGGPVYADEYGVEKEAPTLFTGETVEVSLQRINELRCSILETKLIIFLFCTDLHKTRTARSVLADRVANRRE